MCQHVVDAQGVGHIPVASGYIVATLREVASEASPPTSVRGAHRPLLVVLPCAAAQFRSESVDRLGSFDLASVRNFPPEGGGVNKELKNIREQHGAEVLKKQLVAKKAAAKRTARCAAASSSGSRPSANADRVPAGVPIDLPEGCSERELAAYLPPAPGCRLRLETLWHTRVRVSYPKVAPPYSLSRNFQSASELWPAARECILWAWTQHAEETGERCPWEWA